MDLLEGVDLRSEVRARTRRSRKSFGNIRLLFGFLKSIIAGQLDSTCTNPHTLKLKDEATMSLAPGQMLGPYKIVDRAGAGGMGEVFKAHDTRLDRTVAIKVLPALYAGNTALRSRFEREAKAISSLNHPHICTLHDIGRENGADYLVLEYLEGQTLTERLKQGPLGLDELLRYGVQIADALEQAHRQGLVHRDLKPQNIIITKNGAKLLDFGLAKLQVHDGVVEGVSGITRSTPLTGEGTIIGTIQYMAPEQLEGKEVDKRSDIFAFGAVLYEMATGQRAFQAASQASLIAAILTKEPRGLAELQPLTPPMLERAIKQCLAKDPDQRWQSAGDLKRTLQWISEGGSQIGLPTPVALRRKRQLHLGWVLATLATLALAVLAFVHFSQPRPEAAVMRFTVPVPEGLTTIMWPRLSPDGSMIAFLGRDSTTVVKIYVRALHSLTSYSLPGTENAGRPFWSPDSKSLAYFVGNQLKKSPAQGGPAQLICEVNNGADGSWGAAGVILFDGSNNDSIRRVSASGGTAVAATTIRRTRGEMYHAWPCFLPDGEHFLYLACGDSLSQTRGGQSLHVASLDGGVDQEIGRVFSRVEVTRDGHLLHSRDGVLYSTKIDLEALALEGEAIPIAENISFRDELAHFGASAAGTLVYRTGPSNNANNVLTWFDRRGAELGTEGDAADFQDIALSPDGLRLAYGMGDTRSLKSDIWIRDLKRGVSSRLTFEDEDEIWPIWSPDGSRVLYAQNSKGVYAISERQSNGIGDARLVFAAGNKNSGPSCWAPDGKSFIVAVLDAAFDIKQISVQDSADSRWLVKTPADEGNGVLSPNGRYLVYSSNETGQREIFVRDLGPAGGKWQISADNGTTAKWRADGKELVYCTRTFDFKSVEVNTTGPTFEAGRPVKLFNRRFAISNIVQFRWDMTPDAQRFLINAPRTETSSGEFIVVLNWAEELKKP